MVSNHSLCTLIKLYFYAYKIIFKCIMLNYFWPGKICLASGLALSFQCLPHHCSNAYYSKLTNHLYSFVHTHYKGINDQEPKQFSIITRIKCHKRHILLTALLIHTFSPFSWINFCRAYSFLRKCL
jgi:hypothetical protein